jgi:predicted phosphoribosyltransferase
MRLRATDTQAGLTPRQRRLNVRGAFSVSNPSLVVAQHILLVDDILTTGATARAAAQSLLKAGAASVWVATLARAQRAVGFGRSSADATLEESELEDNETLEENRTFTNAAMHATQSSSASVGEQQSF